CTSMCFYCTRHHPAPPSFPTRRSSDLMTPDAIARVVERLKGTPHRLVVYHAMVGSQIEDVDGWLARLARSVESYCRLRERVPTLDRKSTRLNSSHVSISYAVFCLKKKN